jgi:hypothetical protein
MGAARSPIGCRRKAAAGADERRAAQVGDCAEDTSRGNGVTSSVGVDSVFRRWRSKPRLAVAEYVGIGVKVGFGEGEKIWEVQAAVSGTTNAGR